eukprot:6823327-Prymnesium_polylepis.1
MANAVEAVHLLDRVAPSRLDIGKLPLERGVAERGAVVNSLRSDDGLRNRRIAACAQHRSRSGHESTDARDDG